MTSYAVKSVSAAQQNVETLIIGRMATGEITRVAAGGSSGTGSGAAANAEGSARSEFELGCGPWGASLSGLAQCRQPCVDAGGEGASGFSAAVSGYRSLAAPAVVTSTRDLEDRVQLAWITVVGANAYQVLHNTENDVEAAQPLGPWLEDVNFEHVQAWPGDNFYWVRAATGVDGGFAGPLSVVSPGRRIAPLVIPTVLEASWGEFKDKVHITWKREAAASFVRLYRATSVDPQAAQAISEWTEWNGFEDRSAIADQTYYYFVQVASGADGEHASGLSAAVQGFRSGSITMPKGLKTSTTPGKIFLSWDPNPQDEDLVHYRVYGGTEPEALTLIDSVRADRDPRALIRDVVPLPEEFNVVDMGLDLSADREAIRTRFVGYFNVEPHVQWLGELFAGRRLHKSDIIVLEVGRTYYFQVAAVNEEREASRMSPPTQVLVTQAVAGKVVRAFGDENIETGVEANAPNPFNASTLLRFALAEDAEVALRIYDALGQVVRQLASGHFAAGRYAVSWDARDEGGYAVGSGVYFYMLQVGERSYPGRMLLLR